MQKGLTERKAELVAMGKTDASVPAIAGRYVIDSLVMEEGEAVRFSWRQYRFANAYRKTLDLDHACAVAGIERGSALRLLRRPDVVRWMNDRLAMQQVKRIWNAEGRWWAEGEKMYKAEEVPKHRLDIWREFGERLEIKPGRGDAENLTANKISITISPEAAFAYREREKAMEAEIVRDETGTGGRSESRETQP